MKTTPGTAPAAVWWEYAKSELDNARVLFEGERYQACAVSCQQAVEKALKAVIIARLDEVPPRSHDLAKLAQRSSLWDRMGDEQRRLLMDLSVEYLDNRYPGELAVELQDPVESTSENWLRESREMLQWLEQWLTPKT